MFLSTFDLGYMCFLQPTYRSVMKKQFFCFGTCTFLFYKAKVICLFVF